ncbi:translation elongation factor Ts [Inmirania thermothiophila]|uniref:Elongation factor Ts n=1 Tax=Inmirania thermothiophila TaxID=1750597 RepID=A0A3N1Y044_9GAMM|nr:translation elongation factor Ts [Inmirania thermothiophila]ROR32215.1 elongation factor Ts [Inmirania thermothiophila]
MQITAALVKELRERTGAGMMECKKALVETGGDIEAAIELMRKSGQAKADKKAGRVAAEGIIAVARDGGAVALVEVNSETDFVAKDEHFVRFAEAVAQAALEKAPADLEALLALPLDGGSVEEARRELVAKVGENIQVRRFARIDSDGVLGVYRHGTRIGVVVELAGGDETLARDLAMHVAASRPQWVRDEEVPEAVLAKEREIYAAQAADSGKPAHIVEKMVEGRLRKWLAEVTLLGQPFVKDPDQTVGELVRKAGAEVRRFVRLEVGEGIEKRQEDFAAEVMAQARGQG